MKVFTTATMEVFSFPIIDIFSVFFLWALTGFSNPIYETTPRSRFSLDLIISPAFRYLQ